jgi:hypothetical protein
MDRFLKLFFHSRTPKPDQIAALRLENKTKHKKMTSFVSITNLNKILSQKSISSFCSDNNLDIKDKAV